MLKNKIRKIDLAKSLSTEIGFSSKYSQKLLDTIKYLRENSISNEN